MYILRQHQPNLLLFHLLTLDSTQHRYGPRTQAAMNTMALLDTEVAAIVQTLEETGLAATTTSVRGLGSRVQSGQAADTAERGAAQGRPSRGDGREGHQDAGVCRARGRQRVRLRDRARRAGQILAQVKRALAGLEGHRRGRRTRRLSEVRAADAGCERSDGRTIPDREGGIRVCRRCRRAGRHRRARGQPGRAWLRVERSRSAIVVHRLRARDQARRDPADGRTTSISRRPPPAFSAWR